MQRDGQREVAIGDPLRFQLHERIAQAPRFHVGRAIDHRRRGAFRLLDVGHHRVPLTEVVALRAAYLAARSVQIPRSPFERDGHHAVEAVQVIEEIRRRPGRRGQERVENHGLAVEPQMPAFGFEFAVGKPPVQAAAGRPIPRGTAGLVHQLGEKPRAFVRRQNLQRREVGDERTAGVDLLPKARRRADDLLAEIDRFVRIPPPLHPRLYVVLPPRRVVLAGGGRGQFRVVAPRDVRLNLLDARPEERAPLALPEVRDGRQAGIGGGEGRRPAQEVEIDPRPGVDAGEHPLPATEHGVKLLGGVAVNDGRRQAGKRHQLAAPGEARPLVGEPAPIRQLVGQRAGRVVVGDFQIGGRHDDRDCRRAWVMRTYHGEVAHFAGS